MKTMSGSTRNLRPGLHVGLALVLTASLTLEGRGLRLVLDPYPHAAGGASGLILWGALACLLGVVLTAASALRDRRRAKGPARSVALPQPRGAEEAAVRAHSQKMQALGLLAGGVAHDFNNRLHVIRNSLEILQRQEPQADTRRYLDMIHHSADGAAALTRQLLAFSRPQPLEVHPLDPNDLVAQVTELLRHALGERITIETVLGRGVWNVAADAGQLETALINLAVNARDAMSHAGQLTIETANATLDESFSRSSAQSAGNRGTAQYVMIAVSDTGSGMPPEVAAHACEPFFTTKGPGEGTGLGLSQVAGFAQQSGGCVRISSAPGRGTTVRLYLPKSLSGRVPPAASGPGSGSPPGRESGKTHWRAWPLNAAGTPAGRLAGAPPRPAEPQRPKLAVGAGPER